MAELPISITVDDAHLDATESIARVIGESGLRVDRVVAGVGMIRVYGAESDLAALRAIDGVIEAQPERRVQLPKINRRIPQ